MDSERDRLMRADRLTAERWDRLPFLLPRATVLEWTGLDRRELSDEVRAGRLRVFKPKGSGKSKYFKSEIAQLACIPSARRIGPDPSPSVPIGARPLDSRAKMCSD